MDNFSVNASEVLFSEFPKWRGLARVERADDGAEFLIIEVAAPPEADAAFGLVIDTANEEITVGFDHYHAHFDSFVGDGEHFGTKAALEFIKQILSERVAVVSWWSDETWRGSAQTEAGKAPSVPTWTAGGTNRVRVRSWRGTLNHDGSV